jgi:hypothetical protein
MADIRASQQKGQSAQATTQAPLASAGPTVGGFRVHARRKVQPSELSRNFSELSFLELSVE